ncbi:ABC-type proline/glycine betaine transport system permease subunit [Clostridium beijerinckii]|nr:ABC-type proline/glycine betaine transport system permease subunit [Clostridium beijerinckii]
MNEFLNYIFTAKEQIISLLFEHIKLTALSVGIAIIIGMPLGILTSYVKKLNKPILGIASVVQAIPSMALLGFAIPFFRNRYATSNCNGSTIFIIANNKKYNNRN